MVSKLKALEKSDDNALVEAVCGSAHQIWQAGLGAFARAQEEGGDVFTKLVQQGVELQKRTQQFAGDKSFGVTDTVTRLAENVSRQASGSWEKLEKVFEDRVARSLRNLGVTTQEDIKGLSRQIDELNKSINALAKKSATTEKPAEKLMEKATPKRRAVKAVGKAPAKSAMKAPATKARKQTRPAASQA